MKSTNNVEKSRGKFKGLDRFEIELLESDIEHSETETEEDGNNFINNVNDFGTQQFKFVKWISTSQ